jgi:tetrahydromethanopterin S-methyltransferase subunit G
MKNFFLYTDEEVEENEKNGMYTYENGVDKGMWYGMSLGILICLLLFKVIDFIVTQFF